MPRIPPPKAPRQVRCKTNVSVSLPLTTIAAADKMAAINGWSRSYTIAELLRRSLADAGRLGAAERRGTP